MATGGRVRVVTLTNDDEVLSQAIIADTVAEATVRFGRNADRAALTRKAVEAATELLAKPARVLDFLPSLAVGEVQRGTTAH